VQEFRTGFGGGHQRGVDLIGCENLRPPVLFVFLSHAGPDVGVNDVGAFHGGVRINVLLDLRLGIPLLHGGDNLRLEFVAGRRGD
jgi:hypothetical protein